MIGSDDFPGQEPKKRPVALIAVCGGFVLVGLVTVVSFLSFAGQGEREVEKKLNELREAGYTLSLEEIDQRYHDRLLNPAENAAPLYQEAFLRLRGAREVNKSVSDIREALLELERDENLPGDILSQLEEMLEQNAKAFELLRMAAERPYVRFNLHFTDGYDLMISHVGAMREGVRLLALEAMQQTSVGETDVAVGSLEVALAVAAHLADEPILISQLTRIAIVGIVCETLEWLLARDVPSQTVLKNLEVRLRSHEADRAMTFAMGSNVAIGNTIFTESGRNLPEAQKLLEDRWSAAFHVLSGKVHRDHLFYLKAREDGLQAMNEPVENWSSYDDSKWHREADDKGYLFSAILLPDSGGIFRAQVNAVARVRLARILLALERYRAEEGDLPDDLEALSPRFLEILPIDPFSGQPFSAKREEGWLVLESAEQLGRKGWVIRLPLSRGE